MQLVSYGTPGAWKPGILVGSVVVDTRAAAELAAWAPADCAALTSNRILLAEGTLRIASLVNSCEHNLATLRRNGHACDLASTRLGPPVPDPQKIICIGLNYHDHAREVGAAPPKAPIFFAKYANSLIGPADNVVPPRDTNKVDYEAEVAVVIGRQGRYIPQERAMDHVFGAMAFNDVSARDLQMANQLWTGGKAIDTFAPCGPALVSADRVGDVQNLRVRTRVGGNVLQDGNTSSMIFPVREIIAFLSRIMTLEPGDIIATGTPAGVAAAHDPPRYLKSGDVVEVDIENLGVLRNLIADAY